MLHECNTHCQQSIISVPRPAGERSTLTQHAPDGWTVFCTGLAGSASVIKNHFRHTSLMIGLDVGAIHESPFRRRAMVNCPYEVWAVLTSFDLPCPCSSPSLLLPGRQSVDQPGDTGTESVTGRARFTGRQTPRGFVAPEKAPFADVGRLWRVVYVG